MARVMSDTEIRRRKKVQGHISQVTGGLGLASLGAFAASKAPGAKVLRKTPRLFHAASKINAQKAGGAALGLSTAGAGIGGAGSFNFASYTAAEGKKKAKPAMPVTPKPVQKSLGIEASYAGEVAKEWKPNASKFDAEASRMRRSGAYETGGGAAAGGLAAGAGYQGLKAGKLALKNKKVKVQARNLPNVRATMAARKAKAVGHGKVGLALGGAAAATGAATLAVKNRNQSRSWAPYAKRDSVSAFGVDHEIGTTAVSKKVLTAEAREKIKPKNFAMPGSKSYPIHDKKHARNALARAAQSNTKGSYKAVAAKVHEKFPDIGKRDEWTGP